MCVDYRYVNIIPNQSSKDGYILLRLSLADLADPEVRIPHSKADRLWGYAFEVIDAPCFGLKAGQVWHPSHAHVLGYLWLATSSLKDGIERMVRYSHVLSERNDIRLEYGNDRFDIILSDTLRVPYQMDAFFALTLELCRVNYGRDLKPLRGVYVSRPCMFSCI